jgi:hypothetical protein
MSQTNGTTVSGLGTTNNNGHSIDSAGNVQVDFVWGNFPLQPNDDRPNSSRLDYALDNHVIAETGYNGYPLYTPNSDGAYTDGVAYIIIPNVLGQTTASALDALKDAGYVASNITTATAATNAAKTVTAAARVSGSHNLVFTASGAGAAYAVGTQVVVSSFSGGDAALNGTYTVTDKATNTFTVYTTATTTVSLSAQTAAVIGLAGTIKTQSVAAGTGNIALGTTITVTPWAAGS